MTKVTSFMVDDFEGNMIEWVKVEDDNGGSVCMSKAFYDSQQKTLVTESAPTA